MRVRLRVGVRVEVRVRAGAMCRQHLQHGCGLSIVTRMFGPRGR